MPEVGEQDEVPQTYISYKTGDLGYGLFEAISRIDLVQCGLGVEVNFGKNPEDVQYLSGPVILPNGTQTFHNLFRDCPDNIPHDMYYQIFPEGAATSWHKHHGYELLVVADGQGQVVMDEYTYYVEKGCLLMVGPGQWHQVVSVSNLSLIAIFEGQCDQIDDEKVLDRQSIVNIFRELQVGS